MNFTLAMPRRIHFGAGAIGKLKDYALPLGRRFLLVFSRSIARNTKIDETFRTAVSAAGGSCALVTVSGEPEVADVDGAVISARSFQADCVIGIGGGSVLDLAKAVAAIAPQASMDTPDAGGASTAGSVVEYLEGVGSGRTLVLPPLPLILVPTTAGTGAEATRNAVISSRSAAYKKSLRSDRMLAEVALVDPDLCRSCPREVIARSGLDALTQLIEPFLSRSATPLVDTLVAEALPRCVRSLPLAFHNPAGAAPGVWSDLSWASLASGIALTNAGLGAVHGFAAALGARYGIAHGTICAALLAPVLEGNRKALAAADPNHPGLERMAQIGRWLTQRQDLSRDQGIGQAIDRVTKLAAELKIPRLGTLGLVREDFPRLIEESKSGSSMKFNPVALNNDQLDEILSTAL